MSKRHRLAVLLNAFVPGAGMILLRREWLGLSLSVCFTLFAQMAVLGLAIIPSDVPRWVTWTSACGSVVIWAASQVFTWRRARLLASPIYQQEIEELCRRCREAMQKEQWPEANDLLLIAQRLDDENPEAAQLRAQVLSKLGRPRQADRWRRRALRWESTQTPARERPSRDSAGHPQSRLIQ